jgi:creatinine amidohydrolase
MLLAELTWPDVDALSRDMPVVIPLAALEQHGRHMPVFTDSMLLGEIVRRTHEQLSDDILVAPLMWLGNSHHHMDFPGTVSADPRVYLDLLCGLVQNFVTHGFKRIVMVNGHGGNDVPGKQATFEMRQKLRERNDLLLLFATYWNLAQPTSKTIPGLQQTEMGHACEWETSMILRIAPQLVKPHSDVATVEQGNPFLPASRAWIMPDRSEPGHVGTPSAATPEKGEQLFQAFTGGLVAMLHRVIQWDGSSWEG